MGSFWLGSAQGMILARLIEHPSVQSLPNQQPTPHHTFHRIRETPPAKPPPITKATEGWVLAYSMSGILRFANAMPRLALRL